MLAADEHVVHAVAVEVAGFVEGPRDVGVGCADDQDAILAQRISGPESHPLEQVVAF